MQEYEPSCALSVPGHSQFLRQTKIYSPESVFSAASQSESMRNVG